MLRRLLDPRRVSWAMPIPSSRLPGSVGDAWARVASITVGVIGWAAVLPSVRAVFTDAGVGLDVMDESHYLLAAQPSAQGKAFNSIFGWYTAPLWQLSGADLARFRILSALVLVAVALVLAGIVARAVNRLTDRTWPLWLWVTWPAAAVSAALNYYTVFVRTPSYNWFASIGLMLLAGGAVLVLGEVVTGRASRRLAVLAGSLCALGGFATAIGKATTAIGAVAVLVMAVAVLWLPRRRQASTRRALAISIVAAAVASSVLLLVHAVAVQPLLATETVFRRTAAMMAAVDPGAYGAGAARAAWAGLLNEVVVRPRLWIPGLAVLALVALAAAAAGAPRPDHRRWGKAGLALVLAQAALVGAATIQLIATYPGGVPGLAISTIPFVLLAESSLLVCLGAIGLRRRGERRPFDVVLIGAMTLTLMGLLYPLGTNVEYATQLPGGVVLLVAAAALATALLPGRTAHLAVGSMVACVLALGVVLVPTTRAVAPYRIAPLPAQTVSRVIVPGSAPVLVDKQTAQWIDDLRSAAALGGWSSGTPLFDVTWHPASVVALEAEPPKVLLPALPGWPDPGGSAAFAAGQEDPARWQGAWLLVPTGQRDELTDVATRVWGRQFPRDYERLGVVTAPYDHQSQGLWRPRR